jgi:hypothetical protein
MLVIYCKFYKCLCRGDVCSADNHEDKKDCRYAIVMEE